MKFFKRKTIVTNILTIRCANCNHEVKFSAGVSVLRGKEVEIRTDITNLNNDEHQCPNCDRNLVARVSTVRKRVDKKNDNISTS